MNARRILVADDDPQVRSWLERLLANAGFEVFAAGDGVEALEIVDRQPVDLVLADVWMPRMSGIDLLDRLHQREHAPPVIVLTGDGTSETVMNALRRQAHRYMTKPFSSDELLRCVRQTLEASAVTPFEVVSATSRWVELMVPCTRDAADRVHDFMMRLEVDIPDIDRDTVAHAFRELLMNAVEWGGQFDPERRVRIACVRGERVLLYRIADPGQGFRREDLSHAAISHAGPTEHVEVRERLGLRPGGFGMLLTQALVDELIYNERGNEVVFVKFLK